ncbi:MAG: amidohydrolase family protein [Candidatus Latescibacteria bacterium]|nr:amidohydrolase family protein [Candidatus Latescibacterota bacterium]
MIEGTHVIDFHGHTGLWDNLQMVDDPQTMLGAMDAVGIDQSCLFNIFHPDGTTANDHAAAFVAQHPARFLAFAYVSPTMPEGLEEELARAVDQLGMRAIKVYPPYTPYPLDHPAWDPIYQFAHDRGLALIAHTGSEATAEPRFLATAAARFPRAHFVAGHSGNIEPYRSQAIDAAQRHANFYLETCSTFRTPGVIEELVQKAGADRVLFGSDTPLMDPRPQLGKIVTAAISDEAKRLVLGGNAQRLLGL